VAAVAFCGWFWRIVFGLSVQAATGSFGLNLAVEAPPSAYVRGPTQTGVTRELELPTVQAVDRLCKLALGGLPVKAERGGYYMGCYIPLSDTVVIPTRKAWPSGREWEDLRAHEWAHARGWRHRADGRGTDWETSLAPRPDREEPSSAEARHG
jgi:hypothetical protein